MHKPRTAHLQTSKRVIAEAGPRCRTFSYGCASCEMHLHFALTGRAPSADWDLPERTEAEWDAPEIDWTAAIAANRI